MSTTAQHERAKHLFSLMLQLAVREPANAGVRALTLDDFLRIADAVNSGQAITVNGIGFDVSTVVPFPRKAEPASLDVPLVEPTDEEIRIEAESIIAKARAMCPPPKPGDIGFLEALTPKAVWEDARAILLAKQEDLARAAEKKANGRNI